MADRVFEDRVGLLVIDPARGVERLPKIRAYGGGLIRDVFLPRSATPADVQAVRDAGLACHLWVASDGLTAGNFVARTLADMTRLNRTAVELNFEGIPDAQLATYLRTTVSMMRASRPNARLRLNQPPWKGFALPPDLLEGDRNLYAAAQNYEGNMDELLSPLDVASDMTQHGAPETKVSCCYAAACTVQGSSARLRTLPWLLRLHRGVIFSDDLMVEAGLL